MKVLRSLSVLGLAVTALAANAQLVNTTVDADPNAGSVVKDNALGANEYGSGNSQSVTGNGRSSFSGAIGGSTLYWDLDATNLSLGLQVGGTVNDVAIIWIDSKAGGFNNTSTFTDTADDYRSAITRLALNANETFAIGADYAIAIGQFGIGTFELSSGSYNFLGSFDGSVNNNGTSFREFQIAKSTLAISNTFDYFVTYGSSSGWLSNEALPEQSFYGPGSIEFGSGTYNYAAYNRVVPEPASMAVLGLGLAALKRRRRK